MPPGTAPDLVERGRRVLALEGDAIQRVARELGPPLRARRGAAGGRARAPHRLGRREVGAHRAQDRRDVHLDRHAGDLPPSGGLPPRRPGDRRTGRRGRAALEERGVRRAVRPGGAAEAPRRRRSSPSPARRSPRSPEPRPSCSTRAIAEEACAETLAPTTSTTVALALGDALAVTLLEVKGFRREDFAALHPGGSLGRRLLLRVGDVMLTTELPTLAPERPMRECVVLLAQKRGTVAVVTGNGRARGHRHRGRSDPADGADRRTFSTCRCAT